MNAPRTLPVPADRLPRWFENFAGRHGEARFTVDDGRLVARAADGSVAEAAPPFGQVYDGSADPHAFAEEILVPEHWGILLVRKGGFAVAALEGTAVVTSKVGQRHVQGRTKAGGQSQQRFARRRDNQARQAYEAAAGHAHRVLVVESSPLEALVCGGDRQAVEAVLTDSRLAALSAVRTGPWLAVADPKRAVLDAAVADACSAWVTITEA
ncbi:MAG TPA: acVLRF1 family peptidyl-tRNA hydrolase [Nocardioidaceae bacterium]